MSPAFLFASTHFIRTKKALSTSNSKLTTTKKQFRNKNDRKESFKKTKLPWTMDPLLGTVGWIVKTEVISS